MLSCREATELYSQQQDHKLSLLESVNLRMHLAVCSGCRNFGRHMHVMRTLAHSYARSPRSEHSRDDDESSSDDG